MSRWFVAGRRLKRGRLGLVGTEDRGSDRVRRDASLGGKDITDQKTEEGEPYDALKRCAVLMHPSTYPSLGHAQLGRRCLSGHSR